MNMDPILHNIPAPLLLLPCQYIMEGTEVFHSLTATVVGIVLESPQHKQKGDRSISERIYTYSGIIVRSSLDGALQINHRHLPSPLSIPSSSTSSSPVVFSISFFLYRHLYHTTNTRT